MIPLIVAIAFTLGVSGFCSLLEAMVLSITTAEIEHLKDISPRRGHLLERFKSDMEETSSAILALNTIANTLGSVLVGGLAISIFGEESLLYFSVGMSIGILVFSEILPKNVGILYRGALAKYLVYPLSVVRYIMLPLSFLCKTLVKTLLSPVKNIEDADREITLLVQKGANEGQLTQDERDMVSNALSLDDIRIQSIMTPRTVVKALDKSLKNKELNTNTLFARMPVYEENLDNIVGMVRRRDILGGTGEETVESLMRPVTFIPETASGADALQHFLKKHQQMAITVDEFGATSGVLTLEDIFEHILGKEIYEKDDPAVDMRVLALKKKELKERKQNT